MLIAVHLHICDFPEPIKHSLLQPSLIIVICNLIELICLRLHRPSLVKCLDHLVEIAAFDHRLDLLDGIFMSHTLAEGLDGVVF